ncbi:MULTISPECIES: hypothetical protein [Streptosporangium]|uniref:Uncharacterized protein n=1 Tax=Streptosporangium brasiliense TaxID=47480 RepID=A0ABT9RBV9_9ACTN|nr:hypothetical protein [Streptosporangium brasiliense]MDP9865870.1 hypothetical protein [Streptosporangium brasiliense]
MRSPLFSRRIAATLAGAALISLTAACGGSGNAALCTEATKLMTDYSSSVASFGTDLGKYNEANQKLADSLKALAGKADGELASALNDFSATWASFKIDEKDPAASAAALQDIGKKTQEAAAKFGSACA